MTKEEALELVNQSYGKGYEVKILEIIERKGLTMLRYKVLSKRDGFVEYRIKGWCEAMAGWDYPYRRKW